MLVVKRDGRHESVKFDKITARIDKLSYGLDPAFVEPVEVAKKVIEGLYDGVSTLDLDNLAAEIAARDPHNADTPILFNLFIINSFL